MGLAISAASTRPSDSARGMRSDCSGLISVRIRRAASAGVKRVCLSGGIRLR